MYIINLYIYIYAQDVDVPSVSPWFHVLIDSVSLKGASDRLYFAVFRMTLYLADSRNTTLYPLAFGCEFCKLTFLRIGVSMLKHQVLHSSKHLKHLNWCAAQSWQLISSTLWL